MVSLRRDGDLQTSCSGQDNKTETAKRRLVGALFKGGRGGGMGTYGILPLLIPVPGGKWPTGLLGPMDILRWAI